MSKQKIVITGGLGYIGTELCKLYSGETRHKDIIVLDSRFLAERVKQLSHWGIKYVQGNILDESILKETLSGANIIYHLAGVTDVAYTKTQSNDEKDKEIREYGVTGTKNVIKHTPAGCKLIFPSTHVVFEGLKETKLNLAENEPVCPVLTYAKGKAESEQDIIKSGLDYIIARLASVYGYSESDTMRINIMPNLFSKIASQNGSINLFSGGIQYKSLVAVQDVARALKHLAELFNRDIYHISNENLSCKDVADICKSINPKVNITSTQDEIPNLGYTLSNHKLKATGFKFLYNIHDSIKDMISRWAACEQKEPEQVTKGINEYKDERGRIVNYELPEPINLVGYIESKKGTVRANHYHPIQEQKCILIKGKYVSVTKDLSSDITETRLVNTGDLAVIQPNVAHAMVFLEDSIFLNLVNGERNHENYGITHTIPYELVDEYKKNTIMSIYKLSCRVCGNTDLKDGLSLGWIPLANNLIEKGENSERYPLEVKYCPRCCNAQLSVVVPPEKMFDNYLYVSSTSASFRKHFEDAANNYITEFGLTDKSLVVDIGSNDGVFLKPLQERGVNVVGVEPAKNIAKLANDKGINTINSYFNYQTSNDILNNFGKADIITASNVFAHSDNLVSIAQNAMRLLKENGVFIIEVQYIMDMFRCMTFDNIYHEHTNYWSVSALNYFFTGLGYCLYKVEPINTHGGSIRVYVKSIGRPEQSVTDYLKSEQEQGINKVETFQLFAKEVSKIKENVRCNINYLKSKHRIAAYGSPAKATTALNYFGVEGIEYTVEDNELKLGKLIPGINIPIRSKEYLICDKPGVVIVLAWNFYNEIVENNKFLISQGVRFISIKDLELTPENFTDVFA